MSKKNEALSIDLHVSTGGGLWASTGIIRGYGDCVSTTRKSSYSARESGAKCTVYWQLIPGAMMPPSPGNLPEEPHYSWTQIVQITTKIPKHLFALQKRCNKLKSLSNSQKGW